MRYLYENEIKYAKHPLKRLLTVTNFISADYVEGNYAASDPHSHPDAWELSYCASGHLVVHRDAADTRISPGQFVLVSPGTVHDYGAPETAARFFVLCFTLAEAENLLPFREETFTADSFQKSLFTRMILEVCNAYEYDHRLEERVKVLDFQPSKKDPFGGEQLIASSLEMILLYALRGLTMQGDAVVRAEGFRKAVQDYLIQSIQSFIEENACMQLSVSDIAEHFNYSRTYLSSLFRESTGTTLKEYITGVLLKKAVTGLINGNFTVSDVAAGLGFESAQYFSHWFKRITGVSPREYQKRSLLHDGTYLLQHT